MAKRYYCVSPIFAVRAVTTSPKQPIRATQNPKALSMFIDLSHTITDGLVTYPGLPTPIVADHLTREAAEKAYGPGVTFQIGLVTLCTNTGTYIDVPFHRYADGHDLSALALERVAYRPAVVLNHVGVSAIELHPTDLEGLTGQAVLIRTDHSDHFATAAYTKNHPYITEAAATALVGAGVACVGIDSLNIDATLDVNRPAHSILLGAQIPIIEHLTNLRELPADGFTFTAVPPKIVGAGTFTVRAFASI